VSGALRDIAPPFVAAAPAGARVRTRLRVSDGDAAVLWQAGMHLGSLAGRDLAARCREGRLDAKGRAESRRERKRALTAESSSRWAGAVTRTSEDAWQLADRNLKAEHASLAARVKRVEARLAVQAGENHGRTRGYATSAERHQKHIRLKSLRARAARVEQQVSGGSVSVTRGGRRLLRARQNLAAAGLTGARWREQWESSRLFLTADGEKDKAWGNETIRWNPEENWLEVRLPRPLEHLANRVAGRYRLSCPVQFPYRGDEVAAQAATGAARYDISRDPETGRWYLDASWKTAPAPPVTLGGLREHPVVAVDVNAGHLAVAVLRPDGNLAGTPFTVPVQLAGLPAATRDGRLRAAISTLIATAKQHGAQAVVIENLDFAQQRAGGREHAGNRPSRGKRGRKFRHLITGIPTAKFRDRLVQITCNAGLHVIVVDPAYTSRWGAQHWLALLREHHLETSAHHAASVVIGRRGQGYRARRRANGNHAAPEDAARPARARTRIKPAAVPAPRKPTAPRGARPLKSTKTRPPHRTTAGNQVTQDRSGPPAEHKRLTHAQC
jgi:IS605 OrfB family transposase